VGIAQTFRPKDEKGEDRDPPDDPRNPTFDFRGEKRWNETHQSTRPLISNPVHFSRPSISPPSSTRRGARG
jgi:hypothetical protein